MKSHWRIAATFVTVFALLPFILFDSHSAYSQESTITDARYVVDIELQTLEQFQELLVRADELFLAGETSVDEGAAVVFVLHGPVLRSLLRSNYLEHRDTVDTAARLSAFGVIDLKACKAWMRGAQVADAELQPFVQTVSYGPAEVERLMRESNYVYF